MKRLLTIIALWIFLFQPANDTISQSKPISREKENTIIKKNVEIKQDSILENLDKLKDKVDDLPAQKTVYRYKTRWRTKIDTVYFPIPDSSFVPDYRVYEQDSDPVIVHDTIVIHDTVKKQNFFKRLFNKKNKQ